MPREFNRSERVAAQLRRELAQLIKRLLHDEGYTIAGAKRQLRGSGRDRKSAASDPGAARETALRAELMGLRETLSELMKELDRIAEAPAPEPRVARVERVSPSAVRQQVSSRVVAKKPSSR